MDPQQKLLALKSVRLLDQIPEAELASLGQFLKPVSFKDGALVFEEGSQGQSMYFISGGQVRISKRVSGTEFKDLAILSPGDSFGEMALIEDVARSARAAAVGDSDLFELARADMNAWFQSRPEIALGFFTELVQQQSKRLRRTSTELTLLFDLANIFLERIPTEKELLAKVLEHCVPHLEGDWAAQAYVYNVFNEEMEFAASRGDFDFGLIAAKLPVTSQSKNLWLDASTYYVSLPGPKNPLGYMVFRAPNALSQEDRDETGRTLSTAAKLLASALENIQHRTDEALRQRLKKTLSHGSGL